MGSGMGPIGHNSVAFIYHALGDLDSFFASLNKAVDLHVDTPSSVMYFPLLARARENSRYPAFLGRLRR